MTRKEKEEEKQQIIDESVFSWDRRIGESMKSYRLFLCFKDMGRTRSYVKVFELTEGMNYAAINQLGTRLEWFKRAEAFDAHQDREFQIKLEEEILQSRIRQQRIGAGMQELAEMGLEMLKEYPEELSPADISKLIDIGVKIERLALGDPSEIIKKEIEGKVEVEVAVEEVPKDISAMVGRELAIRASKKMDINV